MTNLYGFNEFFLNPRRWGYNGERMRGKEGGRECHIHCCWWMMKKKYSNLWNHFCDRKDLKSSPPKHEKRRYKKQKK
jgi:hypothetical protein